MTEKETLVSEWISKISTSENHLCVSPYVSGSKTLIVETPIDDIVPEPGHDVIIFVVEHFWRPTHIENWVRFYNEKFPYYRFFEDTSSSSTFIHGVETNNQKFNLILCQSKIKLSKIRKKLFTTEEYSFWTEKYLEEVLGEDVEISSTEDISG